MKISVFTIADYVTEQNGKLVIVGSFDNWLSSKFPFTTDPFGVAIKGYVEDGDYGKTLVISVGIKLKNSKDIIFEITGETVYPAERTKEIDAINSIFMIRTIAFQKPGIYEVECRIDKKVKSSFLMEVRDVSPKKKAKKKVAKKKAKRRIGKHNDFN